MTELNWLDSGAHGATDFRIEGAARPVTGALWLPEDPQDADSVRSRPMVLLGHGASGDRYQAPLPYLARRLSRESEFAVLAIDGPVHGLRQVGDGARGAFFAEMQRPEFIDDMVTDWQLALAEVCASRNLQPQALGYFGLSMGTIFGIPLLASALQFDVAALGLCGITGAAASIGDRLRDDAGCIQHPILFLMQLEDELFDRIGCLALFDAFAAEDRRLHANPGLHPEVPAEEVDHALVFLSSRLTADKPRRVINPLAS